MDVDKLLGVLAIAMRNGDGDIAVGWNRTVRWLVGVVGDGCKHGDRECVSQGSPGVSLLTHMPAK